MGPDIKYAKQVKSSFSFLFQGDLPLPQGPCRVPRLTAPVLMGCLLAFILTGLFVGLTQPPRLASLPVTFISAVPVCRVLTSHEGKRKKEESKAVWEHGGAPGCAPPASVGGAAKTRKQGDRTWVSGQARPVLTVL